MGARGLKCSDRGTPVSSVSVAGPWHAGLLWSGSAHCFLPPGLALPQLPSSQRISLFCSFGFTVSGLRTLQSSWSTGTWSREQLPRGIAFEPTDLGKVP